MKNNIGKTILLTVFVLIVLMFATMSFSIQYPVQLGKLMVGEISGQDDITIDSIESQYVDNFGLKSMWIGLSGSIVKALNMRDYYSASNIYVTDDKIIWSRADETSTDYEVDQTVALKKQLDSRGIDLLYVNAPTKYLHDEDFEKEFDVSTYSNRNADRFLQRIEEQGVNCLDLRQEIDREGINIKDMFYHTDHHWTVPTGLWATKHVMEKLNEDYGYDISGDLYEENAFRSQLIEKCWLGEQGVKVGSSYVGLDDFTVVVPAYDTEFQISNPYVEQLQEGVDGDFNSLINYQLYESQDNVYTKGSYHYSYIPWGGTFTTIHNANATDKKKVLLLGDSYSQVVEPFMALGVSDVTMVVMRNFGGNLMDYIDENDFDTVIILYAEFMVGAHDDESNANYGMFKFLNDK